MVATHDNDCEWRIGHDCTCGLGNQPRTIVGEDAIIASLKAEIARLTAELEESRAGEEGALMIIASERAEVLALRRQLAEARAATKAAYERAARVADGWGNCARDDDMAREIRALATEAETTALAEIVKKAVDAETRGMRAVLRSGCDLLSVEVDALKAGISIRGEMQPGPEDQHTVDAIREIEDWIATAGTFLTARLDQRKECTQ